MKQVIVSFFIFFISTFLILLKAAEKDDQLIRKLIKNGSKIYSLDESASYLLPEAKYFFVSYDDPEKPTFVTLHDRHMKAIFKTSYQNIVDTDAVTQIDPNFDSTAEYKNPTRFQSADKKFEFNVRPSISFENVNITELSEIYQSELSSATGNRFELKTIIPSSLGIDFGISLNYQSIFWDNSLEEVQFSSLNAGPYLEIPFGNLAYFKPNFNIGAELSLSANGSSGNFRDEYSKTVWHIGLQNTFDTNYGPFLAEIFFRKHELLLSKTNRPIESKSKTYNVTSIGIALGYRWDLSL